MWPVGARLQIDAVLIDRSIDSFYFILLLLLLLLLLLFFL